MDDESDNIRRARAFRRAGADRKSPSIRTALSSTRPEQANFQTPHPLPIQIDKTDTQQSSMPHPSGCTDQVPVGAEKLALPYDGVNLIPPRANPPGDCRIRDNDL